MITKDLYRAYFNKINDFVSWKNVCRELNINYSNFRHFAFLETDKYLSIEKCELITNFLSTRFDEVANEVFKQDILHSHHVHVDKNQEK